MLQGRNVCEAETHEIGDLQRTRFRDVAERIAPNVAILRGVGKLPNSHTVQNNPEDSLECDHSEPRKWLVQRRLCSKVLLVWNVLRNWYENGHTSQRQPTTRHFRTMLQLMYSGIIRRLNYFSSACVVQGSGGVRCLRTEVRDEFLSSSR